MTFIHLDLPWFVLAIVSILAAIGLGFILVKFWEWIRFLIFLLWGGIFPPKQLSSMDKATSIQADEDAQAFLQERIRNVWYSFSPVQWLDLDVLRSDCHALVKQIAQIYFPESKLPELEVALLELLQFNERTARRIRLLVNEFPSFHRLTIATILDAKSLIEKTRETMDKKTVKSGRRIASRIWTAINAVNPNYWIQRFLFRGASEVIGRKVITSVYRIVGIEAIQLYRSSALQISPQTIPVEEALDPDIIFKEPIENAQESLKAKQEEKKTYASPNAEYPEKEERMADEQEWILPEDEEEDSSAKASDRGEKLNRAINKMLSAFVEGSLHLWDKMVNVDKVVAEFQKKESSVQCLSDIESLPVEINDAVADAYISKGRWLTAAEGAATGFGGFLLLSADAVSLLALQLRTIQQIGYCYGFDVSRPEEKLFAAKLLAEAYAHPSGKERDALKKEMRIAANLVKGKTPFGLLQKRLFLQGFSKIAQKIGVRFGSTKAAQIVPVLGSAIGGIVNQQVTKDIAKTAKDVYKERFLERKKSTES